MLDLIKTYITKLLNFYNDFENLKKEVNCLKSQITLSSLYPTDDEITNLLDYKWQYFKFTNIIPKDKTTNQIQINITNTGLTINLQEIDSANHKLLIKVVDPLKKASWETPWMDACNATSPNAMFPIDGTRCVYGIFSNTNERVCFIGSNTSTRAIFYVLLGIPINLVDIIHCDKIDLIPVNKFKEKS